MSEIRDYLEAHPELEDLTEEELQAHLDEAEANYYSQKEQV